MTEVKQYKCDICGTEYKDKKQAEEGEENHVETIEIVSCKFVRKEFMNDGFLTSITVKSEDGRERRYDIWED